MVRLGQRGGAGLDPIVRELTMLTALACLGLGLAWAYEADYFAMAFAVAAAFAQRTGNPRAFSTSRGSRRMGIEAT
jgi:hypothetical protein